MLSIEFEPPRTAEPCACCGGQTTALTRFVYEDGNAHAVYLASYSDNHAERVVSVALGLGEWGDGASPDQRVAFAFNLRSDANQFQIMVIDPDHSPWSHATYLGSMLSREEALAHPLIKELFHITDHIVAEDAAIKTYLSLH